MTLNSFAETLSSLGAIELRLLILLSIFSAKVPSFSCVFAFTGSFLLTCILTMCSKLTPARIFTVLVIITTGAATSAKRLTPTFLNPIIETATM